MTSAEQWAVTRQTDDRHFDLLEEIRAWTGSPLAELGSLTNTAAWFADFEDCVGIDAACNAMDLFAEAAALARLLSDEDTIDQLLRELNEELFVLLRPVVAAAHGRVA